jgi:phosphoribosylformylglycinamidine synthase
MSDIHEIRVFPLDGDTLGQEVALEAERTMGLTNIDEVRTTSVYRVEGVSEEDARLLATALFTDPVSEGFTLNQPADLGTDNVVEVAYRPGVMNPQVGSIMKAAADLGVHPEAADASVEYGFVGELTPEQVDGVVGRLLMNDTVEHVVRSKPDTLTFEAAPGPVNTVPIRGASEAELMALSQDKLFLNAEEMKVAQGYFQRLGREPTDAELETFAATWSEHCGHKTFNADVMVDGVLKEPLYRRIKNAAREHFGDLVVSAFSDNSGVIRFYDGQAVCGKVETHNSPSAIEPYGGAMTGSGGVFRDIMGTGKGARTIISTDMFCFAPPDLDTSLLPGGALPPDYLQRRVVQGVRDYGNRMGVPTANGSVHYHEDFRARPTVIVGAYGIMPERYAGQGRPEEGDLVVVIGGRTGRDGIHGATFSSGEMTERTADVNASAVQIGNAIEEKRMSDALIEARDADHIRAITDCGAAGFASAIGEMGEHTGVTVDIARAPLKYPGLAPWEIWVSESQERMVAAIAPENIEAFLAVCAKHNVEATVLGEFDDSNTLTVNYGDQSVVELDYEFLRDGLPRRTMVADWRPEQVRDIWPEAPADEEVWVARLKAVLAHGNVCSKEPIVRQYDHGVQGGNVVSPFGGVMQDGPNDALVTRPLLDKPYGLVQSHGMNPILNRLDPYEGTVWAVAEAAANYVAAGGDIKQAAAVGNYIWPFPDEESMGSLDRSVDAAVDMMHTLGVPVISGKDSLSSTYRGSDGAVIKIPPVYAASFFGRIEDVEKTMTTDIKQSGSSLYLVGRMDDGMGGSAYYDVARGSSGRIPVVDQETLPRTLAAVQAAIAGGNVLSCHDVSEGGVVTTVAEMCFGGDRGAVLDPSDVPGGHTDEFLFNETAGCFVVEVGDDETARALFGDVPHRRLGTTIDDKQLQVRRQGEQLFSVGTDELKEAWQAPMKEIFHT